MPGQLTELQTKHAPRLIDTIFDLYLDLPPLGRPSFNVSLLEDMIATKIFPILCRDTCRKNWKANVLEAVFTHVHDNFRGSSESRNCTRYFDHDVEYPPPNCIMWFTAAAQTADVGS